MAQWCARERLIVTHWGKVLAFDETGQLYSRDGFLQLGQLFIVMHTGLRIFFRTSHMIN